MSQKLVHPTAALAGMGAPLACLRGQLPTASGPRAEQPRLLFDDITVLVSARVRLPANRPRAPRIETRNEPTAFLHIAVLALRAHTGYAALPINHWCRFPVKHGYDRKETDYCTGEAREYANQKD